jgi:phenylacetate-CoA ligase
MGLVRRLEASVARDVVLGNIFRRGKLDFSAYQQAFNRHMNCTRAEIEAVQLQKLQALLRDAQRSRYYRERMAASGLDADFVQVLADLTRLPTLEKACLRSLGPAPFLTRQTRSKLVSETAGTSGIPVRVIGDVGTKAAQLARRWACLALHGIRPGDREARLWGRSDNALKSLVYQVAANRRHFCFTGSISMSEERELNRLLSFRPDFLYGYSSLVLNLAELLKAAGKTIRGVKAVICTAESLQGFQKRIIEDVFGCPVLVEYGCSEVDIIAHTCPKGFLHVVSHDIYLEVTPFGPQADGCVTGEAIVTDLTNTLMPIIRYRLGDLLQVTSDPCECGWATKVILEVQGRTTNRFLVLPSGNKVHAVLFAHAIESLANSGVPVSRFLVKQVDINTIEVYLEGRPNLDTPRNLEAVKREIKRRLPESMTIAVLLRKIPVGDVGKYSYFVALEN